MEAKSLRKIRESFGRCTLNAGFYDELLKNLQARGVQVDKGDISLDVLQQKQLLKNDIAFLLLAAADQPAGNIALSRLATQKGKSMLNVSADQFNSWVEALCAAVKTFDLRHTSETEIGWREIIEAGFKIIQQHKN